MVSEMPLQYGVIAYARFVLKRTENNSERRLERRNTWVYPFQTTQIIPKCNILVLR
jgi:hypothetical protein